MGWRGYREGIGGRGVEEGGGIGKGLEVESGLRSWKWVGEGVGWRGRGKGLEGEDWVGEGIGKGLEGEEG